VRERYYYLSELIYRLTRSTVVFTGTLVRLLSSCSGSGSGSGTTGGSGRSSRNRHLNSNNLRFSGVFRILVTVIVVVRVGVLLAELFLGLVLVPVNTLRNVARKRALSSFGVENFANAATSQPWVSVLGAGVKHLAISWMGMTVVVSELELSELVSGIRAHEVQNRGGTAILSRGGGWMNTSTFGVVKDDALRAGLLIGFSLETMMELLTRFLGRKRVKTIHPCTPRVG